jgi:hypothetical protein
MAADYERSHHSNPDNSNIHQRIFKSSSYSLYISGFNLRMYNQLLRYICDK